MDANLKTKWVEALRGGEFKQTTGTLRDPSLDAFCCLGVLCKVAGAAFQYARDDDGNSYDNVPVLKDRILSDGENGELSDEFVREIGIPDQNELIRLNDGHGEDPTKPGFARSHTFPEIADYIEANIPAVSTRDHAK